MSINQCMQFLLFTIPRYSCSYIPYMQVVSRNPSMKWTAIQPKWGSTTCRCFPTTLAGSPPSIPQTTPAGPATSRTTSTANTLFFHPPSQLSHQSTSEQTHHQLAKGARTALAVRRQEMVAPTTRGKAHQQKIHPLTCLYMGESVAISYQAWPTHTAELTWTLRYTWRRYSQDPLLLSLQPLPTNFQGCQRLWKMVEK